MNVQILKDYELAERHRQQIILLETEIAWQQHENGFARKTSAPVGQASSLTREETTTNVPR